MSKRMNIGIVTNTFPPNKNGVSVMTYELAEQLRSRGHGVFVATPEVKSATYPDYVLPLKSVTMPKAIRNDISVSLGYAKELEEFFGDNHVDIIHTQDTLFGGFEGVYVAQKLQVPALHTYHTHIETYGPTTIPGLKRSIRSFVEFISDQYDGLVAPSVKMKSYLTELTKTPIYHIPNPVSVDGLTTNKEAGEHIRSQLRIPKDATVFITFSRLVAEKSIDIGMYALEPLMKCFPDIHYIVLGSGSNQAALASIADMMGLSDRIHFPGKYQRSQLGGWCSAADIFLFTSYSDNLPTNLFEAGYCGVPIISVADAAADYMVLHQKTGLQVEEKQLSVACAELYKNSNYRTELAVNMEQHAKQYYSHDFIGEYVDLYEAMIAEGAVKRNIELTGFSGLDYILTHTQRFRDKLLES